MNAVKKPLFVLNQDCPELTNRIIQEVEEAGMQALRSFDLDSVRSFGKGFSCPVHGASPCTCHLVVLLILTCERGSLTMILEGRDQQTSIYLDAGQGGLEEPIDSSLTAALTRAILF